jgi:hypothetical protein
MTTADPTVRSDNGAAARRIIDESKARLADAIVDGPRGLQEFLRRLLS